MRHHSPSRVRAFAFPLLLALLLQGASCRDAGADANAANRNAAGVSTNEGAARVGVGPDAVGGSTGRAEEGAKDETVMTQDGQSDGQGGGVETGEWGGSHVRLEVTDDGAEVEFDCAHGQLSRRPRLDSGGRFDVAGTFVAERGGPVRLGQEPRSRPARYSGKVRGKSMTLNVTLTDDDESVGSFTLEHGKDAQLTRCK